MASTCFSLPDRIRDRAAGAASEGLGAELPGGLEERWEGRLLCFEAGSWRHCRILAVGSTIARHKSSPLSAGSSPSHAQCSRLRSGLFTMKGNPVAGIRRQGTRVKGALLSAQGRARLHGQVGVEGKQRGKRLCEQPLIPSRQSVCLCVCQSVSNACLSVLTVR